MAWLFWKKKKKKKKNHDELIAINPSMIRAPDRDSLYGLRETNGIYGGASYIDTYDAVVSDTRQALPQSPANPHSQFTLGSMVCIDVQKGDPLYGVVKWVGTLTDYPETIAGVELEKTINGGTDGTYYGTRFFTCPPGKGYFCPVNALKQDTRYMAQNESSLVPNFQSIETCDYGVTMMGVYAADVHI
ncbi:PREDICTED: ubiquitin carboxyl-terminal hydrolase CYLD-like [Amphimedon queenslandica]|uniref:CAP-Gly domain-containing protein n=2 Tax=Amphimedon queenslandica TaxID=400682 RepID=A0AAN0JUC7_AMPQE|nr:PREDICTED: ubiquitin carboxyl-terminal hydrolase CYLD-like [Amphimedon queenslandica]|eukprot:XP_019860461.1 PREDICTED: ubiquitin carboxyl-terminal hydrolase CYLD-like [Amphimedon queenslandica]